MTENVKIAASIFILLLGIANAFRFPNYMKMYETPWQFSSDGHRLQATPERTARETSFLPWTNTDNNGWTFAADRKPENLESDSRRPLEPPTEANLASADVASPMPR